LVRTIDGNESMRRKFESLCRNAQASICKAIEDLDGEGKFRSDAWVRENGGGGISRVLSGGKVFEKVRTAPHRTHRRRARTSRGTGSCILLSTFVGFHTPFPSLPFAGWREPVRGVRHDAPGGAEGRHGARRGPCQGRIQHRPSQLAIVPSPPPRPSSHSMICAIRAWPRASASRSSPAACRR
jgi:hypothetical protein